MKNIVFITTGQPTTNPRLVKEAETLIALGYNVKVICCFYQSWAVDFDKEIINKNPDTYLFCGGDPLNNKWLYFKTRIRQKIALRLFNLTKGFGFAENAISRVHTEATAMALKQKADLYIAHNLGALPAAVAAAKKNTALAGYDAEDMHTAQYERLSDKGYLLNNYIEQKYFQHTHYFTAASPLIAQSYKSKYPYLRPLVLNNTFKAADVPAFRQRKPGDEMKLFWFSQTIGADRGLAEVIEAIGILKNHIQLHLIGNCTVQTANWLQQLADKNGLDQAQLQIHAPVPSSALFDLASGFDIGIAAETGIPLNRDICLTNKIFVYMQCGLAIIASDTRAQTIFLKENPGSGKLYSKGDASSLAACLKEYTIDENLLNATRLKNYLLGQDKINWEEESKSFVALIKDTLASG